MAVVASFTQDKRQGNKAGVFIENRDFTKEECLKITKKSGYSECVFITFDLESPRMRFFSPLKEMDLCGHALIAGAEVLFNCKEFEDKCFVSTNAGQIFVYRENGIIKMEISKTPAEFSLIPSRKQITELFGIDENLIKDPIAKISVGTPKVLVELCDEQTLWNLTPKYDLIAKEIPHGIYLYFRKEKDLFYARQFNPSTGINEDPVTGVAAAALSVLLKKEGIRRFTVEQGHVLSKKGSIFVENESVITVGGYATLKTVKIITA